MKVVLLITVSLLQWKSYRVSNHYGQCLFKYIVLIVLIAMHFFVFPTWSYAIDKINQIDCANPVVGLHIFFLIVGIPLGIIIHTIYFQKKENKIQLNHGI